MRRAAASSLLPVLLLAGCTSSPPVQRTVRPATAPAPLLAPMEVGLCEDYPKTRRTIDAVRTDLQLLRQAGCTALRVGFSWVEIEPERGQFDWAFWDDLVAECAAQDIRLVPYICYTPEWAASKEGPDFWRSPPKNNEEFAAFARTIAARYRGQVRSWELWNEPDNAEYWSGTVEQYAELVKAGSAAVRSGNPDAKVVLGGIAWQADFVESLFRDHGISPSVDIVNAHSYFETWSPEAIERLPDYLGRLDDTIARYGNRQLLWLAEIGYSSHRRGDRVSAVYTARFDWEHSPRAQAAALFRSLTLIRATGLCDLTAWYRINDLPQGQEVIGDANNLHLGLRDASGEQKPAFTAMRFFTSFLSAPAASADRLVLADRPLHTDVEAHAFVTSAHTTVLIAWLRPNTPGIRPSGGEDARQELVTFTVSGHFRSIRHQDELGQHLPAPDLQPALKNGAKQTRVLIPLMGSRISVITLSR